MKILNGAVFWLSVVTALFYCSRPLAPLHVPQDVVVPFFLFVCLFW